MTALKRQATHAGEVLKEEFLVPQLSTKKKNALDKIEIGYVGIA